MYEERRAAVLEPREQRPYMRESIDAGQRSARPASMTTAPAIAAAA